MKRICAIFFAIIIINLLAIPAFSQSELLVDEANLLSNSEKIVLSEKLKSINEKYDFIVSIATVNSFGYKNVVAFSDDLFEEKFGTTADGCILVININTRDWYISTQGFGITALTDAGINYISKRFVSDLSNGNYYSAFETFADLCEDFVSKAKGGNPYDVSNMPKAPKTLSDYTVCIPIAIVVGLIITLGVVGGWKKQLKSVAFQSGAASYAKKDSMLLTLTLDTFLYNNVVRTRRAQSSSGGGGSSTHTSSSGTSHGGGGGKF